MIAGHDSRSLFGSAISSGSPRSPPPRGSQRLLCGRGRQGQATYPLWPAPQAWFNRESRPKRAATWRRLLSIGGVSVERMARAQGASARMGSSVNCPGKIMRVAFAPTVSLRSPYNEPDLSRRL